MMRLLLLFTFYFVPSLYAQQEEKTLEITYIANEGYLLKTDHHKILIDALFTESYGIFDVPEEDTLNAIMKGKTPFDNIDICLLTHYHKDHCSPKLIAQYLNDFPNVQLVTNKPALVFIDGDQFGFVGYKKQFCELTPRQNEAKSFNTNNIDITSHAVKHLSFFRNNIDIEQYMYNTAYTIEMEGIRIFHSGDSSIESIKAYLEKNKKWKPNIDVAFLYYEILNSKENLNYIISTLHPKEIVIMHVPLYLMEKWKQKKDELKKFFPELYLLNKAKVSKKFIF